MKKTSKKEASLVLQDKIKSLIIKQNLKSGDLMPTENELIEQLGVSRSSLREAIKSLEALHILDIRHGVGTFVSESSLVPMIRGLSFHTQLNLHNDHNQLINILDIREILEYGFAPMVLGKISQEQTVLLQKLRAGRIAYTSGILKMLRTVQFHHQICRRTVEINNILADNFLPQKADGIPPEKVVPKVTFFLRHIFAKPSGNGSQLFVVLAGHK